MDLAPEVRNFLNESAERLSGVERRQFMARACQDLDLSHRQAEIQLGWNRVTLRKATHELDSGFLCDATASRGRKPVEFHLPQLLDDIRDLVQEQSQTDPKFRSTRLYCRMSAAEVRRQLIARKGYTDEQLPTLQTITTKLNVLGFHLTKVAKCRPQKNFPKPTPSSIT
jgi:Rhodopirellula transposase DDE domain